jgi:hypothetical protein
MDTQSVEVSLDELKLPIPAEVAKRRAALDALSTLDVPLQPEMSRANLAAVLRGYVERGETVDPVALVRANRSGADKAEAAAVVQHAVEDAQRLLDLALSGAVREMVPTVRTAIEDVLKQVRALPSDTPTTAAAAVHGSERALKDFRALEALADRHGRLRRLHRDLIADHVDQPSAFVLFGDTQLEPPPADWPTNRQRAEAVGPKDTIARTLWLADPKNQSWTPTAAEVNKCYWDGLKAMQQPAKAKALTV